MINEETIELFDKIIKNEKYNKLVHEIEWEIYKEGTFRLAELANGFFQATLDNTKNLGIQFFQTEEETIIEIKIKNQDDKTTLRQNITIRFYKNMIFVEDVKEENDIQTVVTEEYIENELKTYYMTERNTTNANIIHKAMFILKDKNAYTYELTQTPTGKKTETYNKIKQKEPYIFNDIDQEENCRFEHVSTLNKKEYKKQQKCLKKEQKRLQKEYK